MPTYNEEELFRLSNGRYIRDPRLSAIMEKIEAIQPERSQQDDATPYSWDEAGMADLFSELYNNDTRYCPEVKSWYTYDEGAWRKDVGSLLISAKVKEFVRMLSLYCGEIADEEVRKKYMGFVAKMGDRRFRDRLMKDAADGMRITASEFDRHPFLINCQNGTYDLHTMTFREHDWRDFLTMQTSFRFTADWTNQKCDRWETFITEVTQGDADKADYLQRALGYTILGTSKEECMFILHGKTTRNGKSTLLNTIEHMMGDYSKVAPVELICRGERKSAEAANPVLASLKGKRMVTMAESENGGKLDESVIKQYTGGESITARELYQSAITYVPQFTLWLSCNDLPAVRDKSLFASDRLRIIEFNRHFSQEEQDKSLKTYFESEPAMMGIFTWLLAGYARYCKDGLSMPASMQMVVNQYERDNDVIMQYLDERTERSDGASTRAKSLYEDYKLWAKSNGYYVMSVKKFNSEMGGHPSYYDEKGVSCGVAVYRGIKLK